MSQSSQAERYANQRLAQTLPNTITTMTVIDIVMIRPTQVMPDAAWPWQSRPLGQTRHMAVAVQG
jgi:hypothetical protein